MLHKQPGTPQEYIVHLEDNFHYMPADILQKPKPSAPWWMNACWKTLFTLAVWNELFKRYTSFGEDPWMMTVISAPGNMPGNAVFQ